MLDDIARVQRTRRCRRGYAGGNDLAAIHGVAGGLGGEKSFHIRDGFGTDGAQDTAAMADKTSRQDHERIEKRELECLE